MTSWSDTPQLPARPLDEAPRTLAPALAGPGRLGSRVSLGATTARVAWVVPRVLIGVLLILVGYSVVTLLVDPRFSATRGVDFGIYRDAAAHWLHGGFFYYPEQVTGPYLVSQGHVMYPPVALLLFLPFTVLPALLWWAIPLGMIVWRVVALRPSAWGWAGIAACLAWPISVELVFTGNPTIWIVALLALATRWPWASAFVLLKPSLVPFALAGVRSRSWWLALAAFVGASLLFLPMWFDWLAVVTNARGPFSGLLYSLKDVPLMLIPLVAWLGRSVPRHGFANIGGQPGGGLQLGR